ncbi:MAG: type II secretion system GspH family protein [Clostridiaceae bacterium]|jgi:competence protein ComGC|nr:type II secretion system GspH family protein [Clostridiaceae bacterium]
MFGIEKNRFNKISAFTLAEVLITLGIIGVVAALTMPSLIANYRKQVIITQLKKTYSTLSQAMLFTVQADGDYSSLTFSDGDMNSTISWYEDNLKPHLQVIKSCYNESGCWHSSGYTRFLNGAIADYDNGTKGIGTAIITFVTNDGIMQCLDGFTQADIATRFKVNIMNDSGLGVYVDINGNKLPNVIGQDIFVMVLSDRGFVPAGLNATDAEVNADCSPNGKGYFCLEKIIRDNWTLSKNSTW